jgi:predicted RNase H-like HicB family nuclease
MSEAKVRYLSLVIEHNDDGYLASCPGVQGAFAEGDSIEEAIFNCIDVVKMIAEYRSESGQPLGVAEFVFAPDMQISVALPIGSQ